MIPSVSTFEFKRSNNTVISFDSPLSLSFSRETFTRCENQCEFYSRKLRQCCIDKKVLKGV